VRIRRASGRLAKWLGLAAVVGVLTGLVVVGFQALVLDVAWEPILAGPPWLAFVTPGLGLLAAWGLVRLTRSRSPGTGEEYIRVFHDRRARLPVRDLGPKLLAGVATLGLGGSMGLEGPALFAGGTVGEAVQRRFAGFFDREEARVMLVAGAAAGIAAVFKAPLTGLVYAMEVPYRDDVARHVLGPALVASATGYIVEAAFRGVDPLIPVVGTGQFSLTELGLAVALGIVVGLVGRSLLMLLRRVERGMAPIRPTGRIALAAAVLALCGMASRALSGAPLALGPGEAAIHAAAVGELAGSALLALLVFKAVATSVTVAAGGVGGLFFPLVVMGAALGGAFGQMVSGSGTLFPLAGMASLLGAAYHTPLAGVSFVAEATGRAAFVVPAFVATAAAYATIGGASISHRQRFRRATPVEQMLDVPITDVATLERATVEPGMRIDDFVRLALEQRYRTFAVVDDAGALLGVVDLDAATVLDPALWPQRTVAGSMRPPVVVGSPGWTAHQGVEVMSAAQVDHLPVVEETGRLVGVVRSSEVVRLGQILEQVRDDPPWRQG
jgi:CIC family chloride channel protein